VLIVTVLWLKEALNVGLLIAAVEFWACKMGSQKSNVHKAYLCDWHIWVIILLLLQFLTFNFFGGPSQAKYEKLQTSAIDMSHYRLHCQSLLQKMKKIWKMTEFMFFL
jgi:hypothetical protein